MRPGSTVNRIRFLPSAISAHNVENFGISYKMRVALRVLFADEILNGKFRRIIRIERGNRHGVYLEAY